MTKTALNSSIESILVRNGIELSSQLAIDLLNLAAPKTTQRLQDNQPLVGDIIFNKDVHSIDDITSLYCLRFQRYFPVENFSKSSKTSFGYSKESKNGIKLWLHYDKQIKSLESEVLMEKNAVLDEVKTVQEAKEEIDALNIQIENLKEIRSGLYTQEQFDEVFGTSVEVEIKEIEVQETPKKSNKSNKPEESRG